MYSVTRRPADQHAEVEAPTSVTRGPSAVGSAWRTMTSRSDRPFGARRAHGVLGERLEPSRRARRESSSEATVARASPTADERGAGRRRTIAVSRRSGNQAERYAKREKESVTIAKSRGRRSARNRSPSESGQRCGGTAGDSKPSGTPIRRCRKIAASASCTVRPNATSEDDRRVTARCCGSSRRDRRRARASCRRPYWPATPRIFSRQ